MNRSVESYEPAFKRHARIRRRLKQVLILFVLACVGIGAYLTQDKWLPSALDVYDNVTEDHVCDLFGEEAESVQATTRRASVIAGECRHEWNSWNENARNNFHENFENCTELDKEKKKRGCITLLLGHIKREAMENPMPPAGPAI